MWNIYSFLFGLNYDKRHVLKNPFVRQTFSSWCVKHCYRQCSVYRSGRFFNLIIGLKKSEIWNHGSGTLIVLKRLYAAFVFQF
jgi:hypothetical protein